ncbi:MAG: carboxypeptidase regulatory-like domain-containing protein [Acidobacteria bacterium]|nr:carboxypeptidase regulatory-like domain-containing protein [Acidobacteriota bacterium]
MWRWFPPAILLAVSAAFPADSPVLTGFVLDPLGRALAGARIVVSGDGFATSLLRVSSDGGGRFEIAGIPSGRYQVAAAKPGYQVRITSIDTILRRSVNFVLDPVLPAVSGPGGTEEPIPTLKWVLRRPGTDILRDLGATTAPVAAAAETITVPGPVGSGPGSVRGEVVHLEAAAGALSDEALEVQPGGRRSRVRMEGPLGDTLNWRLLGDLSRLTTALQSGETPDPAGREFDSRAVAVGVDFRPTGADDLSVQVQFNRTRFLQDQEFPDPFTPATSQEQKGWGYDARWTRLPDPLSRIDLEMGFLQGRLLVAPPAPGLAVTGTEPGVPMDHRLWNAGGRYRLALAGAHEVQVGVRTRVFQGEVEAADGVLLVPGHALPVGTGSVTSNGWDLDLFGRDRWVLSEPFQIVSTLSYSRTDLARGEDLVVPEVEFHHSLGEGSGWNAGVLIAWRPNPIAGAEGPEDGRSGGVGYQVGLEHTLPAGIRLEVNALSHPARNLAAVVHAGETDPAMLAAPAEGLILAWRPVENRELELGLEKRFGSAVGRLGSIVGEAEGHLAAGVEGYAPLTALGQGSMQYLVTRLQTVLDRSDTELRLAYKKVTEQTGGGDPQTGFERSYSIVDLAVAQRLAFLEHLSRSEWRFLLAYQDVTSEATGQAGLTSYPETPTTYSRVSGGVEIRF